MASSDGSKDPTTLSIVVVGGGLCGMASGLALRMAGHRVTVLERSPEFRELGAGIQLPPNATRLLHHWGLLDRVRKIANEPVEGALRSYRGAVITQPPQGRSVETMYGAPFLVVHRADLLNILVQAAYETGVDIQLGCEVRHVDPSASSVRVASGIEYKADLILGADGEHSVCRSELLGRADAPRSTGDKVVRIVTSQGYITEDHPSWELVRQPSVNVWMGPGAHAVSYLLRGDSLNVVLVHEDTDGDVPIVHGPRRIDMESVKEYFEGWDPAVCALLNLPDTDCLEWTLLHVDEVADWAHESGRLLLIGDAAHAVLPYLAQGAALALEDGAVLGAMLGDVTDSGQVPDVVRCFKQLRQPRAARVRQLTLVQQRLNKLADGPEQEARDRRLAQSAGTTELWDWLWKYDAAAEGTRAWQDFLSLSSN